MMYEMTGIDEVALPYLYVNEIKKHHGIATVAFVEKYIAGLFDARVYEKTVHEAEGYFALLIRHRATRAPVLSVDIVLTDAGAYRDASVVVENEKRQFPDLQLFCTHDDAVRKACDAIDKFMTNRFTDTGMMVSSCTHSSIKIFRREYEPLSGRNLYITFPYIDKTKDRQYPRYLDFLRTLNVFKSKRFKN